MKLKQVQINNRYGMHGVHRNIPVYEMNTVHCSASPMEGYKGTEVTLIDDAAWNEKFSAWALTGATATGNNIVLNNDVTAQGIYETAKNVTLQATDGGSIAADRVSGFIGDSVTLSNTPNSGYEFSAYTLTGANLTGNKFNLTGSDVTAKAWFYSLPNAHVTYSMGNKLARDYLPNYTAFNEPDDVMNGLIEFGASGSNFSNDRYFALKYGIRLASRVDTGSTPFVFYTDITLNDDMIISLPDTGIASHHVNDPCVKFGNDWNINGAFSGSYSARFADGFYETTAVYADADQNILRFDGTVQPPADEWTYGRYNNARWSERDMCEHKFVFDKQACAYSAFVNGAARLKATGRTYNKNVTAVNSIKIYNGQNTDGAMFNVELASFSSLDEACRW